MKKKFNENRNLYKNEFSGKIVTKILILDKMWVKFQFLTKILTCDQTLDFWPKFRLLTKISIIDQNFDFRPKFNILPISPIFGDKFLIKNRNANFQVHLLFCCYLLTWQFLKYLQKIIIKKSQNNIFVISKKKEKKKCWRSSLCDFQRRLLLVPQIRQIVDSVEPFRLKIYFFCKLTRKKKKKKKTKKYKFFR